MAPVTKFRSNYAGQSLIPNICRAAVAWERHFNKCMIINTYTLMKVRPSLLLKIPTFNLPTFCIQTVIQSYTHLFLNLHKFQWKGRIWPICQSSQWTSDGSKWIKIIWLFDWPLIIYWGKIIRMNSFKQVCWNRFLRMDSFWWIVLNELVRKKCVSLSNQFERIIWTISFAKIERFNSTFQFVELICF